MTGQIDASWSTPPTGLKELQAGEIRIIARGNDSPEVQNETVRVNAANLNFLNAHRSAVVGFMKAYKKSVDWAYAGEPALAGLCQTVRPAARAGAVRGQGIPVARTQDQLDAIKGEDRVLDEALAAKRIPKPMTP